MEDTWTHGEGGPVGPGWSGTGGDKAPLRMKWSEQVAICAERSRPEWPVQRLSGSTSKVKDSTAWGSRVMSGVLCVPGQALPPGAPQSCPGVWLQAPWLTAWMGGLPESPCRLCQGQSILRKFLNFSSVMLAVG